MISELHLDNFKCFKDQSMILRDLTLLTGMNGMGKSTVLQSLLLLRQSVRENMLPRIGLLLNGRLTQLGTAADVIFRGAERDEIGIRVISASVATQWRFRYGRPTDDVLAIIEEPPDLPTMSVFGPHFHYLSAERLGPRYIHDMSSFEVEQQLQMGPDGRYAVAFLEAYSKNRVSAGLHHKMAVDRSVRSEVMAWLGEISPGVQLFIQPYPELGRMALSMGFEGDRIQAKKFTAPNVGFGLSYVLPVLVAILASPVGTMILLENPEAHLNPGGQVAMGQLLALGAQSGLQVIVETHSDHVLNGVRVATKKGMIDAAKVAMHYFDRVMGEDGFTHRVQSPVLDREGRIDKWPTGFFDQWEKSLDQLLG